MTCCLYLKQSESNYDFSDVSQNKDLTVCTTPSSVVILYTCTSGPHKVLVFPASTCSLEYSLASISFLTLFETRIYSS